MGFFSNLFGKKSKTTTNNTSTTTPNIPSWIQEPVSSLTGQISALGGKDPYSFVAPASDLQTQAWTQAKDLTGGAGFMHYGGGLMGAAGNAEAPKYEAQGYDAATSSAHSLLSNLDAYQSPYLKDVVDAALADFDFGAGKQKAEDDLALAASGAFGGSGAALTKSMTADNLIRGRASTSANLRDQSFTRATALAADDANRRQQMEIANMEAANRAREFGASSTNTASRDNANFEAQQLDRLLSAGKGITDMGTAFGMDQRANLDTLAKLGEAQRGVQQDYLNAPLTMLGYQTGQLQNLPLALFGGSTTNSNGTTKQVATPSPFEAASQAAQIAAMFMGSDERLKKDIVRIGTLPNGLGLYEYEYIWGGGRRTGVMAQEVQKIMPEAVSEFAGGFLGVDYGALK